MEFPNHDDFDIYNTEYLPIYNISSKTVWTPEEDELLKSLINKHGAQGWSEIAVKV